MTSKQQIRLCRDQLETMLAFMEEQGEEQITLQQDSDATWEVQYGLGYMPERDGGLWRRLNTFGQTAGTEQREREPVGVCECRHTCNEDGEGCSHSGEWHQHEGDDPCPVHPEVLVVG